MDKILIAKDDRMLKVVFEQGVQVYFEIIIYHGKTTLK